MLLILFINGIFDHQIYYVKLLLKSPLYLTLSSLMDNILHPKKLNQINDTNKFFFHSPHSVLTETDEIQTHNRVGTYKKVHRDSNISVLSLQSNGEHDNNNRINNNKNMGVVTHTETNDILRRIEDDYISIICQISQLGYIIGLLIGGLLSLKFSQNFLKNSLHLKSYDNNQKILLPFLILTILCCICLVMFITCVWFPYSRKFSLLDNEFYSNNSPEEYQKSLLKSLKYVLAKADSPSRCLHILLATQLLSPKYYEKFINSKESKSNDSNSDLNLSDINFYTKESRKSPSKKIF